MCLMFITLKTLLHQSESCSKMKEAARDDEIAGCFFYKMVLNSDPSEAFGDIKGLFLQTILLFPGRIVFRHWQVFLLWLVPW